VSSVRGTPYPPHYIVLKLTATDKQTNKFVKSTTHPLAISKMTSKLIRRGRKWVLNPP